MSKRFCLCVAVCFLLLAPLGLAAQQEAPVFTFVAEWAVPRAQWGDYTADFNRYTRPVLEKMFANGTISGWGAFTTVVHTEGGITHGIWMTASGHAGLEATRQELLKNPPSSALLASTKHTDVLLRSLTHKGRSSAATTGYLVVSATQVQPGKGGDWRDLWDKYTKPTYDELFANGTILSYSIDVEQIHTENPGWRYVVYVAPNIEAVDKVNAAFRALIEKRSPEERRGIGEAFADVTVAGAHWDLLAQVLGYAHK